MWCLFCQNHQLIWLAKHYLAQERLKGLKIKYPNTTLYRRGKKLLNALAKLKHAQNLST